ncbi:target of rapamycin complex subunit lst8 [Caerostris extrusa]|uniref:Target of rapamycin complex subunit lst8 n=1 Tax=Caerostris extrusa TaxID=172846 RepID=A0AAV4NKY5_CAEEX|nr:target of rapamycin complex subunit lst8 [Caerostris extrusa]
MASEDPQRKVILATGGYDHTIHFWEAHSGVRQCSAQYPSSQINSMEIHPHRQLLAVAGFQHIRMYDIYSSNPNPVVNYENTPQSKNFTAVGFQEEGRWMFTGSEDQTCRVWDLRTRTLQCQRLFNACVPVNCVCLHPNQGEFFIGDQNGAIYWWDLKLGDHIDLCPKKAIFRISEPHVSIQYIHVDPEGTFMSAVDNKGNCYIFILNNRGNENSNSIRHFKFQAHDTYALKCKFSPDSTLLVTTSADCSAKIWRTADLNLIPNNQNNESSDNVEWTKIPTTPLIELRDNNQRWVWDVAFSADSQYLFTASSDNLARLWNITKGEVKREYSGHSKALTALAFKDGV